MERFYIIYVLSKVYLNTVMRVFENTLARRILKDYMECRCCAPQELRQREVAFQVGFFNLFNQSLECRNCVSHCCHSRINRFDLIDCYLYGFDLECGMSPWHKISHLFYACGELCFSMVANREPRESLGNCSYLSAESGCVLVIGERPGMCISGACAKVLRSFSREDLRKYSDLLSVYMRFRFECLVKLIRGKRGLRKPGSMKVL